MLENHNETQHKHEQCQYCKHTANDKETLQDHMIEDHEEIVLVYTMAQQVNQMSEGFVMFETFKQELSNVLKTLLDNQNSLKQELFLLRNNQVDITANVKKCQQQNQSKGQTKEAPKPDSPSQSFINEGKSKQTSSSQYRPPAQATSQASSTFNSPPNSAPPPNPSPQTQQHEQILYIGDSISANVDMSALEVATQAKFVAAKAYSAVNDTVSNIAKQAPKFPSLNFTEVVPAQLKKGKFKTVILQAGSVDITNLNTKDKPSQHMEYFRQETVVSAKNTFTAAVNALNVQPSLNKIIIMKQIPRYDPLHVDPLALKPALSMLFNNTLTNLWMESPHKDRIYIGSHNIECTGAIKESRYRHTKSGRFDGIHLLGSSGQKAYTLSVLNILNQANVTSTEHDYHLSCAQFKYQNRQNRTDNTRQTGGRPDDRKQNSSSQDNLKVPTFNRFTRLNDMRQENW